ncbi:MAG: arylsulfatase [Lentisphaerae bacterium]|jgi:arylsulfatase A|nr:arylsulfatase [Lentisphaerota bacterium]MBT4821855.1 arylsulfatase [Lentisphaerota bacterium]MBT5605496.1 arylsulfatase [Lentisphaerota bacterium]MBT7060073.1 arylsulfatase [Lentisphaerota bacterium]MBT7840867.1 arylsulfatase [Lentisphaerota bacterium]
MNKPNIIYILADDMGYGDVSCLNPDSKIHTPNIDRLASEGMAFTDAHSSSAVCTPSRYSILTGRYNWRSSLKQGVLQGYDGPLIESGRETAASLLRRHGYHTNCVGKWHLGWDWHLNSSDPKDIDFAKPISNGPRDRGGFDRFFGIIASLDMPPFVYVNDDLPTAIPDRIIDGKREEQVIWSQGPIAPDFTHDGVLPAFAENACNIIRERAAADQPFFLYFPLNSPHAPCLPTPEFKGASGLNDFADFCLMTDAVVGQVLDTLAACGLEENTIVIFTSDNGCTPVADFETLARFGHHPSYVFRGHKADIYEGGHRIPLLIRWPEQIEAGRVCDETVCLVDFLATCADIVGESLSDNAGEDSVSNLPLWRGETPGSTLREATVHHSYFGAFSIRQGRWKLEFCPGSGGWSSPRPGQEPAGSPLTQLYDLDADIGERTNLVDQHPAVVAHLTNLMIRYVREGRSTPGAPQANTGPAHWPQLAWMSGS